MSQTIPALIERLEKATESSRELDYAIDAMFPRVEGEDFEPRYYTSSIDAALTLVPGNLGLTLVIKARRENAPFGKCAAVYNSDSSTVVCPGTTPAIALCIAALRAREGM